MKRARYQRREEPNTIANQASLCETPSFRPSPSLASLLRTAAPSSYQFRKATGSEGGNATGFEPTPKHARVPNDAFPKDSRIAVQSTSQKWHVIPLKIDASCAGTLISGASRQHQGDSDRQRRVKSCKGRETINRLISIGLTDNFANYNRTHEIGRRPM